MRQENKKHVLLIDASVMFQEFIREKFSEANITVDTATGNKDAYTKLISLLPDLVILEIRGTTDDAFDFLIKKSKDPNGVNIPTIATGPRLDTGSIKAIQQLGILKYFTKPIQFDVFFETVGKVLHANFSMDVTPCVLEIHLNKNIIFIEIAQGMNRDKMSLLKYRLSEIMDSNRLDSPKVIVMLTALSLSFVDGSNLEVLFDNILSDRRIERRNVKVLSLDSFTKELIAGHPEYSGIEVVTNLGNVLNSVVESGTQTSIQDLISERILASTSNDGTGSMEMSFSSGAGSKSAHKETVSAAIIDDDAVIRQILESAFKKIGAAVELFSNASDFLKAENSKSYSIIILDIFMPDISGFDLLNLFAQYKITTPVIVYSQSAQREIIVQALQNGAKSYLVKPQKAEVVVQKALEIINGNF